MLGLTLRQEFQNKLLKGTQIELTGATQILAADFLKITYPSADLLKSLTAIAPNQNRPVVIIGERGQGKSHLMAVLYHALTDVSATRKWLDNWSKQLNQPEIAHIQLRTGMEVISETLTRQKYKFLWDLLFDLHPHGKYIRGKWEAVGEKNKTDIPSLDLILELLQQKPTVLILDEFQTWFDGLTNTKQYPWRTWAFNFLQNLSEIAKENPELLVLVVSVRNGSTDAYQQIHRVNPVIVDFKGPHAALDRRRLLLHRLFENRLNVSEKEVKNLINNHLTEYFRLAAIPPAEQQRKRHDFIEAWPFAPHLMQLLEDQVLIATEAQETRDLIKILADLFKGKGDTSPVLTAADFDLEDEDSGITSLLTSVSNVHHRSLLDKARRNLEAVKDAVKDPQREVPHLSEIVGALWLRSLALENLAGATPANLQIDITRNEGIDDNTFQAELATIEDNSFNIHQNGDRLVFREEENPRAKLMAYARNDKLFTDGSDERYLAKTIRYILVGSEELGRSRVIVLSQNWVSDPWGSLEDSSEHPEQWDDRLPIIVLPEEPDKLNQGLGQWLKDKVSKYRNTIRFLLPQKGKTNLFLDRECIIVARAALKAEEWQSQSPEYRQLAKIYKSDLRNYLKQHFDRFAVLFKWNYIHPEQCEFTVEKLQVEGSKIPKAIEERIEKDVFIPEDFEEFLLVAATNNDSLDKFLRELREPRPNGQDCIPWLGEEVIKDKILSVCAEGKIAINLRGTETLQSQTGEDKKTAFNRMKGRLGSGKHLEETTLLLPQAIPYSEGINHQPTSATSQVTSSTPQTDQGNAVVTYPSSTATTNPSKVNDSGVTSSLFGKTNQQTFKSFESSATSNLNLLGKVEEWGINAGTAVRKLSIQVDALTGAQLQKLLKDLPDGLIYELNLEKEES